MRDPHELSVQLRVSDFRVVFGRSYTRYGKAVGSSEVNRRSVVNVAVSFD
jgi:hypothetical protein